MFAAYVIYTVVPPILRLIQLFSASDITNNLRRCGAILCLLVSAAMLVAGARASLTARWQGIALAAVVAAALASIGQYLLHFYML